MCELTPEEARLTFVSAARDQGGNDKLRPEEGCAPPEAALPVEATGPRIENKGIWRDYRVHTHTPGWDVFLFSFLFAQVFMFKLYGFLLLFCLSPSFPVFFI